LGGRLQHAPKHKTARALILEVYDGFFQTFPGAFAFFASGPRGLKIGMIVFRRRRRPTAIFVSSRACRFRQRPPRTSDLRGNVCGNCDRTQKKYAGAISLSGNIKRS
jgi:hypothetical protein